MLKAETGRLGSERGDSLEANGCAIGVMGSLFQPPNYKLPLPNQGKSVRERKFLRSDEEPGGRLIIKQRDPVYLGQADCCV